MVAARALPGYLYFVAWRPAMNLRWLMLADAYVDRARSLLMERVRWLVDRNETTPERLAFHSRSRASLAMFVEALVGGSDANPNDIERFRHMSDGDRAAFKDIASDIVRMHSLRAMVHDAAFAPPELCAELVRGAVYTVNPSFNGLWIEAIARSEPAGTASALLSFLSHGTAFEAGGAANASYWFGRFAPEAEVRAFRAVQMERCLVRFVETDDVNLRQCVMAMISWTPGDYAPRLRPLLERAASIATDHPDDYIRTRYQCDTGRSGLIPCLPHRNLYAELGEAGWILKHRH
jgi:hypothetical protein